MTVKTILLVVGLFSAVFFSSCGSSLPLVVSLIIADSLQLHPFLDLVFDEYIDRLPAFQTYLGMVVDYGQWDDFSP
jgi:hypothetical protein